MALPSETEARRLLERVLGYSRADECQVALSARETGNLRFARNTVTTSGGAATVSLGITASFGRRSGFARINELDAAALEREKAIYKEQAAASGKPANIIEKMVEGRVRKYYEEVVLTEQAYIMDDKSKVSQAIEKAAKEIGAAGLSKTLFYRCKGFFPVAKKAHSLTDAYKGICCVDGENAIITKDSH